MTITYVLGNELYVNVTNRCTNRCDFCIRQNGDNVGNDSSLWLEREPTAEEIYDDIVKNELDRYRELVFCGYGEPILRLDDIVQVVAKLKQVSSISVRINTNGQADLYFGKPTAERLKGLVDTVSISLNNADAERYEKTCHSIYGKNAFPAVIAYAKECKKYVSHVVFTVVDVIPPEEIEACRRIAEDAGVDFRVRKMIR